MAPERSRASTGQWKISISHGNGRGPPCCSRDRPHLSSWHTFAIIYYSYKLFVAVYPYFIYLTLHSFLLRILTLVQSPFSFLIFLSLLSINDSWALTAFYISFFSATVREWLGIRGLVKTNKRPCGSPRVATSHNKPPTPCRRRHTVHRARLCSKCHSGFHDNQTATLAVEKCRVMVDGDWCTEPPGWTVWRVRWSRNSKYVKNCKKTWQVRQI